MQKILIVDDNTFFRKTVKESLHCQYPPLTIAEATTREEALRMIPTFLPDLIFMDVHLPDGNGLELTRLTKHSYPDVKIVLLTNYDLPEYEKAAFVYKADHCLSKDTFMSLLGVVFQDVSAN